jgi:RluA family pseudouridine synthase
MSQARKACRKGKVLIFENREVESRLSAGIDCQREDQEVFVDANLLVNLSDFPQLFNHGSDPSIMVATSSSVVNAGVIIAIRTRTQDSFYPSSVSGFVHPPPLALVDEENQVKVIYEDDHLAIVNKPDYITTIGEKRNDLQSCLPFLLRPPQDKRIESTNDRDAKSQSSSSLILPRPVHRLDRRTSGLVLIAKTKKAMTHLSRQFTSRKVKKTYVAIVFGNPLQTTISSTQDEDSWHIIDYPIDNKASITRWRSVCTVQTTEYGTLTLLICRPESGRYHQIRRHLAYCLGTAIVGDTKYDKGGALAISARCLGMFLCSNSIDFEHPDQEVVNHLVSTVWKPSLCESFDDNDLLSDKLRPVQIVSSLPERMRTSVSLPQKFKNILEM